MVLKQLFALSYRSTYERDEQVLEPGGSPLPPGSRYNMYHLTPLVKFALTVVFRLHCFRGLNLLSNYSSIRVVIELIRVKHLLRKFDILGYLLQVLDRYHAGLPFC